MNIEYWQLWRDIDRDPYINMSIDELLLPLLDPLTPILRVYGWNRPSVSIGYVQNYTAAEADPEYAVVRRPTGGGVVYHDRDITYTVAVPASHPIHRLDRMESYHVFHRAVQRALAELGIAASLAAANPSMRLPDRATMKCFVSPTRYDVMGDGKKVAGAAQRRTRDGTLHQGSIALAAINASRDSMTEKLIAAFEKEFAITFKTFSFPEFFLAEAAKLAATKYSRETWNRNRQTVQ